MIGQNEISAAWSAWKTSKLYPLIGQQTDMADGSHTWHIGQVPTDRIRATVAGGRLVATDFTSGLSWNASCGYCGKVYKIDASGYWEGSKLYRSAEQIKQKIAVA